MSKKMKFRAINSSMRSLFLGSKLSKRRKLKSKRVRLFIIEAGLEDINVLFAMDCY
jgi:hypothetical protein